MALMDHALPHVAALFGTCVLLALEGGWAQPLAGGSKETRIVEGVPVYNYQRLREQTRAVGAGSLRRGSYDWIVMLRGRAEHAGLQPICEGAPDHLACIAKGHPSRGGVAFVTIRASEAELSVLLRNHSGKIAFVEPDGPVRGTPEVPEATALASPASRSANYTPSIPWGLDRIDNRYTMDGSYSVPTDGGRGVHVYLADSGILTTHSDFEGRAIPTLEVLAQGLRKCSASDTSCARDNIGHGTHTAGIVAGKTWGVAKKATLHAVKVLGDDNWGRYSWWISALDWVATNGQRPAIISASLGGRGVPALVVAVDAVIRAGVTVVVSAGNENSDACDFMPSGIKSAITVGATGLDDHIASYSNFGSCVDIFAPGSHIVSDYSSSDTAVAVMSGTSMACPHVAGAAALLLQREPELLPSQVAAKLTASATVGAVSGITSKSPNLLLYVGTTGVDTITKKPACDESEWPDLDHGLVCGECKVLVKRFNAVYHTCDRYCASLNRMCTGAWEDKLDTCATLYQLACDQMIPSTDAICECGREAHVVR